MNVTFRIFYLMMCGGGAVVRALDLLLEIAGSISVAALSSATVDKLFTHILPKVYSAFHPPEGR